MRLRPEDLKTIGEYVQVDYSDPLLNFSVSELPLISRDYSFCTGIAIMNHSLAGLAHVVPRETYSLTKLSAEEHIDAMLLAMKKKE